jgi:hypothetical protein
VARPVHKGRREENLLFANLYVLFVFPTSNRCAINNCGREEVKVKREKMSLNKCHILHKHM